MSPPNPAVVVLPTSDEVEALNARFTEASPEDILRWAWDRFGARAAIGTSFQGAGLVMMHLAKLNALPFPWFTIDTGLAFPETQALRQRLEAFLERQIEVLTPEMTLEQQAAVHGPELWRQDPDLCCTVRKVLPLRDRLAALDCWITGLRREQSDTRAAIGVVERHVLEGTAARELVKLNPMASWKREQVWDYIRRHQIPYNPLHDAGYRSIGCRPCTRPGDAGDAERAGRWTGFGKTECGIHTFTRRAP